RLAELAADGVSSVVTVPYGFVNDHMEVVYDLDTEARATASGLGLGYVRAATVGVHPAFIGMLADALTDPQPGSVGGLATCHATCCLLGRPGAPALPTACAAD
ncbi:MAG: ferrochelatase, partial [Propioniciclava sp.]|nr:ferrochelatase [Propioniciclava sp.]